MARCKECMHYDVCSKEGRMVQVDEHTWDDYNQLDDVEQFCDNYIPTADVVPKSEVEKLKNELVIWKQDRFNLYQRLELYEMTRQKVANEIFSEIEKRSSMWGGERHIQIGVIAELKKKYTEVL